MNPDELESIWHAVQAPTATGDLAGRAVQASAPSPEVLLALDSSALRHLLIFAAANEEPPAKATTKGLSITIDELRVEKREPRRYFDIACRDAAMHANFTAISAEILEALRSQTGSTREVLERILARWQWFWGTPPTGLTDNEALGLFGELWFLEFWLDPIDATTLQAWTGPSHDRHDFKWPAASVEAKTTGTAGDGPATHRISTLDQLEDPERGELYLFSLRTRRDPIAAHSLNTSIERIRRTLTPHPELLHTFDGRLSDAGYSPAHREMYDIAIRVVSEELYKISPGFPRLTRESFVDGVVPAGIDQICYSLDLAACTAWQVATAPGTESRRLRHSLSH